MTDVESLPLAKAGDVAEEVRTNPKLPRGWRLYRHGGTVFIAVFIAEEDPRVGARNWTELEAEWLASQ
jgi:hypothetical protein